MFHWKYYDTVIDVFSHRSLCVCMCTCVSTRVHMCCARVCTCVHVCVLCPLKRPGTMTNSVALSAQIVASHTISPLIGPRILWRAGWSSLGSETIQVDPGVSYGTKSKGCIKDNGFLLKGHSPCPLRAFMGSVHPSTPSSVHWPTTVPGVTHRAGDRKFLINPLGEAHDARSLSVL